MRSKYFKKIAAVLLAGFVLLINMAPVSFSQTVNCSAIIKGSNETDAALKARCEAAGCQSQTGLCSPKIPVSEVNVSQDTIKSTNLEQCLTVGYSIKQTDACDGTKVACAGDPNGWRCIVNTTIQPADLSGLKAVVPAYIPKVDIPCNTKIAGGSCPTNWRTDLGSYVGRVYQFGLMIAGLVAFGMLIYGAAQYTLSAGGFASKEDAKDVMLNAVYGLLLLFGAYLVLYTINPNLVKLGNIQIDPINLSSFNEPAAVYVPADNNAIPESSGTSGIPGCLVAVSEAGGLLGTGLQAGLTIESSQGTQQYGTGGDKKMLCTKCQETYTLKDGACIPK